MYIVTISRQVGSYGDVIAAILARKMGLTLVGRDRVHELAQACNPEYKALCAAYETEHGPGFWEKIFYDRPSFASLFQALTLEQAAAGNVVMIGRGSQVILSDIPGVFKIRVVAPLTCRIERIMERYGLSQNEAEEFIQKYDQERENLVRFVFNKDPHDWSLYDMIINTANFTSGAAADIVTYTLEKINKAPDPENVKEKLKNMALAKKVETMIRTKLSSAITRHVEVNAEANGIISITGRVDDLEQKKEIEKIALEYPGVTKIDNQLKIRPYYYSV